MTNKSTLFNALLWLLLALIWGSSFSVIKVGVSTINPILLVAGRMTIGAAFIFCVMKSSGQNLSKDVTVWVCYAITGLLGSTVPFLLITYGEQTVDSALASILMGIAPVATVVMASAILPEERLSARIIVGLLLAFFGLVLLVGPSVLSNLGSSVFGQLSIIAAALCYAANTVYIKFRVNRPALEMASGSMVVGTLFILLAAIITGKGLDDIELTMTSVGVIVYLGLLATGCANLILFYLVPRLGATRVSQINFAVPAVGSLIGVAILGEVLSINHIIALIMIVLAIYLVLVESTNANTKCIK